MVLYIGLLQVNINITSFIVNIAGSSNGRTGAFEASNLGSIPSPAAKK